MNDANQSIRNPANSGATVDTQDDARGGGGRRFTATRSQKYFEN